MVSTRFIDVRPWTLISYRYCEALNDLISLNTETGRRGNPEWGNLPRKFNICVSGARDDFAHTHINDIGCAGEVRRSDRRSRLDHFGEVGFGRLRIR